jgi:hypothetical protein
MGPACYQCGRPAVMGWPRRDGTMPLCIDCWTKLLSGLTQCHRIMAETVNYLSDEMSFAAGMPPIGPRFALPPAPVVYAGDTVLNNVDISNSNIGALNTGTIASIDSAVGYLASNRQEPIATALKDLTEGIASSDELTKKQRSEAVELLSLVATEAAYPAERRRSMAILPTIARLGTILSPVNALSQLWAKYEPVVTAFFSST